MKAFFLASLSRIAAASVALAVLPMLAVLLLSGTAHFTRSVRLMDSHLQQLSVSIKRQSQLMGNSASHLLDNVLTASSFTRTDLKQNAAFFQTLTPALKSDENLVLYGADGTRLLSARHDIAPSADQSDRGAPMPERCRQNTLLVAQNNPGAVNACATDQGVLLYSRAIMDSSGIPSAFISVENTLTNMAESIEAFSSSGGYAVYFLDENLHPLLIPMNRTYHNFIPTRLEEFSPNVLDVIVNREPGLFRLVNRAGSRLFLFYHPITHNDGTAAVTTLVVADENTVYAPVKSVFITTVLRVLAAIAGTVFLLAVSCLLLVKLPVRKLLRVAAAFGAGDFSAAKLLTGRFGAMRDIAGALYGMSGDLSAREHDLMQAGMEAEQASKSKGEFLANMSHEIRTPMNAILGMTYLVNQTSLAPNQSGYISKIQSSSKTLLRIVNDILDFSKIEAGKMGMESIRFGVRDLFGGLITQYAEQAEASGILLSVSVANNVPDYLTGDPLRFEQAMGHLLDYAMARQDVRQVTLSCSLMGLVQNECSLRVVVADNGGHLTSADIKILREAAADPDAGTPLGFQGQGRELSLVLAQKLFVMMGGDITASSGQNKGASFVCTGRFIYSQAEQEQEPEGMSLRGRRVLMLDTDDVSLTLYPSLLANFGMVVDSCRTVNAALDMIRKAENEGAKYDFMLADWRVFDEDSAETLRRDRAARPADQQPLLIGTSSFGRDEVRAMAEETGVDAFLHKPMHSSILLETMAGLLHDREAAGGISTKTLPLSALCVMLVEDNEINRQIAREIMGASGVQVLEAEHGGQAEDMLRSGATPHIILLDLQMPVKDGYETIADLRSDIGLHALYKPVIAMTANNNTEDIQRCLQSGMDDYVSKPFDVQHFMSLLQRWQPPAEPAPEALRQDIDALVQEVRQGTYSQKLPDTLAAPLRTWAGPGHTDKLARLLAENDTANVLGLLDAMLNWPGVDVSSAGDDHD